jgi:hypothetical protein
LPPANGKSSGSAEIRRADSGRRADRISCLKDIPVSSKLPPADGFTTIHADARSAVVRPLD